MNSAQIINILMVLTFLWLPSAKADDFDRLDALCKELGLRAIAAEAAATGNVYKFWDAENATVYFSYSLETDTCVGTKTDYLANEWGIHDAQHRFIDHGPLFWCDKAVDNAILDAVRRHRGYVFTLSYREYLENGEGGPARTLHTPPQPYTRDKCEMMFKKKLKELRLITEHP